MLVCGSRQGKWELWYLSIMLMVSKLPLVSVVRKVLLISKVGIVLKMPIVAMVSLCLR